VVDEDIILFWGDEQRRIITGSDVLGRLLRGIVQQETVAFSKVKYEET
jgi:metal transporter CNNM